MTDCDQIDSLVTPYVDGDITSANAVVVNRHIQRCRVCSGRVQAEQAVQALMRERRQVLVDAPAPTALRARCAALAWAQGARVVPSWRRHLQSLAIAAGLVLAAGAAGTLWADRALDAGDGRRAHRRPREMLPRRQQRARYAPRCLDGGGVDGVVFRLADAAARSSGARRSRARRRAALPVPRRVGGSHHVTAITGIRSPSSCCRRAPAEMRCSK